MIIVDDSSILDKCTVNGRISKKLCEKLILPQIEKLQEQNKTMREALESISKNSCCEPCQEAKLVAREALAKLNEKQGEG